jgi:predicted metalloprotease with PDZ domain
MLPLWLALFALLWPHAAPAQSSDWQRLLGLRYTLRPAAADAAGVSSTLHVAIELPPGSAAPQSFYMPRAVPMGYGQQPYDSFVRNLRAFSASRPLRVSRAEGPLWVLGSGEETVTRVEYDVDLAAMERGVTSGGDSSRARPGHVFLLGYSVFGYLLGLEARPIELIVEAPENKKDWLVFLTLAPVLPAASGRATARAADFYALADSQVLIGPTTRFAAPRSVTAAGARVPLFIAVYAEKPVEIERLALESEASLAALLDYFGAAPIPHFTVIFQIVQPLSSRHTYGFSMEHLESATMCFDTEGALFTPQASSAEWARARSVIAHHVAHAWIPKRASGEGYFPFDWTAPPVIDTIWFSEGFAQYVAADALAGAMPPEQGAAFLRNFVDIRFRRTLAALPPEFRNMPLIELSRLASSRYSEDFRTGQGSYARGGLMAAEMDELIRSATQGKKRLRDALRHLVAWCAAKGRPFRIEELPVIFEEATGVNTRPLLEAWGVTKN